MENKKEKDITEFMKYVIYKFEQCEYMPTEPNFKNSKKPENYTLLILRQNPLDPESAILSTRLVKLDEQARLPNTRETHEAEILRQEKATQKRRASRTKTEKALIEKEIRKANTECGLSQMNNYANSQKRQATINSRRESIKETVEQGKTKKLDERTR